MSAAPTSSWLHKAFVAYVLMMMLLFLLPVPGGALPEKTHLDKVVHFSVFLVFAILFHCDQSAGARSALLVSVAFAAAIEVLQGLVPYRDADWYDLAAGAAGGTLGAALVFWHARKGEAASNSKR
jgi:VanZ family protein